MITVRERNGGLAIVGRGGQVLTVTHAEADQLRAKLTERLKPVSTEAVTPAKARLMRYADGVASEVTE